MKVWIVVYATLIDDINDVVKAVFSSKEAAEEYVDKHQGKCPPEGWLWLVERAVQEKNK